MRKLLLVLAIAVGITGCYKNDYELAQLEIAELQQDIAGLRSDLNQSIRDNNTKADQLAALEFRIIELDDIILGLEGVTAEQVALIESLETQIIELNEGIASMTSQRDALVIELKSSNDDNTQLIADIEDLNNQITVLENREPEVIIEYIEVIRTVTEYVSGGTNTVYVENGATIDSLRAQIEALTGEVNAMSSGSGDAATGGQSDAPAEDVVDTTVFDNESEWFSSYGNHGHQLFYRPRNADLPYVIQVVYLNNVEIAPYTVNNITEDADGNIVLGGGEGQYDTLQEAVNRVVTLLGGNQ